ncbi:MAG: M20/M25/M40 family metallo-hydrolase [Planctomycetes bacterium]|nr:M20/M25/M40 family metallo-hydrolase [Planctomycetota bacterium]
MSVEDHTVLKLFSELLAVPSPSGREERLAELVRARLDELGYDHETDGGGNITVRLAGRDAAARPIALAAHMDEIGMVVTGIEDDGALTVDRSGGLYPCKLGEGPVDIVGDGDVVPGVLSMGSMHRPDAATRHITWADVRILTGLSPAQLKAAGVRIGSSAVPARSRRGPVLFGDESDPLVAAWTFDDRMGVVTLLRLLELMKVEDFALARATLICFTVHEEGGCHGAKALAQRERPEVFIAVDGCPMPPGSHLTLDGRPATWSKDSITHFDHGLITALCRAAEQAGTELTTPVYSSTATDASAVYSVGGAERVASIGYVRESSHGYDVSRLSVFDNLLSTLAQFMRTWR